MTTATTTPIVNLCRVCSQPIDRQPGTVGRPRVTCSDKCRDALYSTYYGHTRDRLESEIKDRDIRIRQLELELSRLQGERARCICTPILLPLPESTQ